MMNTTEESAQKVRLLGLIVRTTPERRQQVYEEIANLSHPGASFWVLVAISTTIAAYGLLSNSTAVVIGAMLVAPLMGPIFGIALGLTIGDRSLLGRAAVAELFGVLLAVLIGTLIGLVPLRLGFGSEILARTQPTLYDIIIALASGLAGAYALMDERVSPALPGVAIATALVPPLATCGLCIAAAQWEWAGGAFLLFFANFLAIQIAAALIFTAFDMARVQQRNGTAFRQVLRRFGLSLLLLLAVTLFMTRTLIKIVAESRFRRIVEASLIRELRTTIGAHLSDLRIQLQGGRPEILATVLTPQEFEPEQVARMEQALSRSLNRRLYLVIRSLISRDADRDGPVFLADTERERRAQVEEQTRFLAQISQALIDRLKEVPGARLVDLRRDESEDRILVTAAVRTPTAIEPAQVAEIEAALSQRADRPLSLIVRSILTRDADALRYLYEPKEEAAPLVGAELRFYQRLEAALRNQFKQTIPGATLSGFRYRRRNGRLLLLAVARTPRSFEPAQVRRMEGDLRRYVHPGTDLIVRSIVGADTAAIGYLSSFDESKVGATRASPSPAAEPSTHTP